MPTSPLSCFLQEVCFWRTRRRFVAWAIATAVFVFAPLARAQTRYQDPAGRFAFTVPQGWAISGQSQADQVILTARDAYVVVTTSTNGDPGAVLESTVRQVRGQMGGATEVARQAVAIGGQRGVMVVSEGRNPKGVDSLSRVSAAPFKGGVLVTMASVPAQQAAGMNFFNALTGMEASVTFSSSAGTARPSQSSAAPTATLRELPQKPARDSASAPATNRPSGNSKGPVVAGEPFSTRTIQDPAQRLPFGVVSVPAKWKFDSRIEWNYAHVELPVTAALRAENPDNEEAVFTYPMEAYYELNPPDRFTRIGQNDMGYTHLPPAPPLDTLVRFIQRVRGNVGALKFEGYKELPGLAKVMKVDQLKQDKVPTGLAVKVTYSLGGKPVEEEFYAVSIINTVPYDGPQGRSYEIYWGTSSLFSFRAPAGTLDKRRPVFAAIVKSFRPNPAWQARNAAIGQYLNAEFNRNLQRGYERIAAAVQLSRQISANNDAMLANIDRQLAQSRTAPSGGGRSPEDKFSDYIRGVDTLEDPYYGSTQLSNTQQFHWTDGFGSYRGSNDVSYDPNQSEVGNWTPMRSAR